MMSLVIHLVMQSDFGADKSLSFLLDNATPSCGKYTCYSISSTHQISNRKIKTDPLLKTLLLACFSLMLKKINCSLKNLGDGIY